MKLFLSAAWIAVLSLFCFSGCGAKEKAVSGKDFINTDNYANRTVSFYYYIPATVLNKKTTARPVMGLIPGLSAEGSGALHPIFTDLADREGFVIIAPSFKFDEKNFSSESSYQFPDKWSGDAFIRMTSKLQKRFGLKLDRYYLHGFSAGAQFSLRFALWRPDLCRASSAHGSGGLIIPTKHVPVHFYVSVGKDDKDRTDLYEIFINEAKRHSINVIGKIYPCGHSRPPERIKEASDFFSRVKKGR